MNDLESRSLESGSNDEKISKKSNIHCSSYSSSAKYELCEIKSHLQSLKGNLKSGQIVGLWGVVPFIAGFDLGKGLGCWSLRSLSFDSRI